jgi:ribosome biogenesis GTPase
LSLQSIGWSAFFDDQISKKEREHLMPARVVAVHKGASEVADGSTVELAKMTGRFRHQAQSRIDYPTVGDWVLVKGYGQDEFGRIERRLERRSLLKRKSAGRSIREQAIAANIDRAFIVQGMGPGFNLRRVERYLVMVHESGIEPIVVLTKTDLLEKTAVDDVMAEVSERLPQVRVIALSNLTGEGVEEVQPLFEAGLTCCVIGVSGAGKSTLLNQFLEDEALFTLPVRSSDGKGVHSTTWRELITLKNGAHVVDTPGMRELGNMVSLTGIENTFDQIENLASHCAFSDCLHQQRSGCAVLEAVEKGVLSEVQYLHYMRLMQEKREAARRVEERAADEKRSSRFYRSRSENRDREES